LPFQGKLWPAITRQQKIELENCSNPVMTGGVVWFRIKMFFNLVGGGLGQWDHDRACFLVNYMMSSSDPTRQYFGLQYFWILGKNTHS